MGAEFTRVYANKYGSRLVARVVKGTAAEAPETAPTLVSCTGEPLKRS
jgi:hypothetical protein